MAPPGAGDASRVSVRTLALRALALLLLAPLLAFALLADSAPIPAGAALLASGASVVVVAMLLLPQTRPPHPVRYSLQWSTVAAIATTAVTVALPGQPAGLSFIGALSVAVWLLTFVVCSLYFLLQSLGGDAQAAQRRLMFIMLLCALAPLWLGPLADRLAAWPAIADIVVAASPLSYLAAAIDYDFLRSVWFYQHSPLGSLRYEYPSVAFASLVYLSLAIIAWLPAAGTTLKASPGRVDSNDTLHNHHEEPVT